jgi:SH3-like domain-containing protein
MFRFDRIKTKHALANICVKLIFRRTHALILTVKVKQTKPMHRSLLLFLSLLLPNFAIAQTAPAPAAAFKPMRAFMSLQADSVNLRHGPGQKYPIAWVYKRRELPVEVTSSFDVWRRIRDVDGTQGWVRASLLSPKRTALVHHRITPFYAEPTPTSALLWRAEPGVVGRIIQCQKAWCQVAMDMQTGGTQTGWTMQENLWGVYPNETIGK